MPKKEPVSFKKAMAPISIWVSLDYLKTIDPILLHLGISRSEWFRKAGEWLLEKLIKDVKENRK